MYGIRSLVLTALTLVWAGILVLVGGRFLILLFDVSRDRDIVARVMSWSDFWVKPFFDLFHLTNKAVESTGGVFEPASAIAFVVYFFAGSILLGIVRRASSYGTFLHA
jgi:hypothetical protein